MTTKKYNPKRFTPRNFAIWLYEYVDRYNYGIIDPKTGTPRFAYSSRFIRKCFERRDSGRIKLRLMHIKEHLAGNYHYYTTRRSSNISLLMIDIDAHEGQNDAIDVAYWVIQHYHPDAYIEPSSNGEGIHLYFLVDFSYVKRVDAISLIASYASNLAMTIQAEGFKSKLCCINGGYTEASYNNNQYEYNNRSALAKIPCPRSQEAFNQLKSVPIQSVEDIVSNLKYIDSNYMVVGHQCCHIDDIEGNFADDSEAGNQLCSSSRYTVNNLSTTNVDSLPQEVKKPDQCIQRMHNNNAYTRTFYSLMILSRSLGRIADFEEWHTFYLNKNLHTPDPDENENKVMRERKGRYKRAAKYLQNTFDPGLTGSSSYKVGEFLDAIRRLLTKKDLKNIAKEASMGRSKLYYEDIDIGIGYHLIQVLKHKSPEQELTVPVDGMIGFFRYLKENGLYRRSCNYSKVKAIRIALLKMGYITLLNDDYQIGCGKSNGISMKWGIGENCPRYEDYLTFVTPEVVKRARNLDKPVLRMP